MRARRRSVFETTRQVVEQGDSDALFTTLSRNVTWVRAELLEVSWFTVRRHFRPGFGTSARTDTSFSAFS